MKITFTRKYDKNHPGGVYVLAESENGQTGVGRNIEEALGDLILSYNITEEISVDVKVLNNLKMN